eukprot:gene11558-8238_t
MSSRWTSMVQLAKWCAEGNLVEVKACRLAKGENVFKEVLDAKCLFPDHERPINHAAKYGWMEIVQYLAPYYTEMEPVKECQLARYLLDAGFHPSEMNSVGLAFFWTSRNPEDAYKAENIIPSDAALLSVMPRLRSAGMSLDKVDVMGHLEYKSILLLCLTHHRISTALWLMENGADVHIVDEHGCNALYYLFAAASARSLSDSHVERLVQSLLSMGIDVNCHFWSQTGLGNTTLIEAIRCKYFSAAKLLLQAGADPNQRGERHMHAGFWLFLDPVLSIPPTDSDGDSDSNNNAVQVIDGMTLSMLHALREKHLDVTVRDKRNQTMRDQAQATESNRLKFRHCIESIKAMESAVGMVDGSQGAAILSDPVHTPPGPKVKATNRKSRFVFFSGGQVANDYRFGPGHHETSEIRPSSYTSGGDVLVSSKETSPWRRKPQENDDGTLATTGSPLRFDSNGDRLQHPRSTKRCTIC